MNKVSKIRTKASMEAATKELGKIYEILSKLPSKRNESDYQILHEWFM